MVEFVGREVELQNLHQLLQENEQVAIAAVAGMGGVGKTELALQYARNHRETYKGGICWLLAKSGDVGIQVVEFVRTHLDLKIPDNLTEDPNQKLLAQVQYCFRHWPGEVDVLLVLDDVVEYKEVKPYLHSLSSRFKVLMTTREKLQPPIMRLDLGLLKPLAAMNLLKSLVGRERLRREPWIARRLCKHLGYLPLGLELVGRYLAFDEDLSLAEILQQLKDEGLTNEAIDEAPQEMTAKLGVAAAFELSWRRLQKNAQVLGCFLSLFALAPIPWKLVENNEGKEQKKARRDLLKFYLLQRKGEETYQLHPLLREFFQCKLTDLEQAEELKRSLCRVMVAVAKDIPETPTLEQITAVSPAIPHIAEVANNLIQYVNDKDLTWVFIGNATFYRYQGLYDQASSWCKHCLEVTKKHLGEEHPDVATSLNNLAELYRSQGRYSKAEPLQLEALALRQRLLGEKHTDVAQSLDNLALLYKSQGRYSEAEPLCLQASKLWQCLLGAEHPDFATSLNNLAELYKCQGRYSEAEPLHLKVLALRLSLLGVEHPDFAISLNNLAELSKCQGRYSEAEPLYLQALALRQRLLGEEHLDVAQSLNNLAGFYYFQGRYSEAEPLYLQALALRQRLLGEEHPDVAQSLNNLAALHYSQGRYSEAEPLYLQALELTRHLLGDEHPDFTNSLNNLAVLYYSQGRYSEAEPLYLQALELTRHLLGDEHPDVALSLNNLALLYKSKGQYSEAELLYLKALEFTQRLLGEKHPDVALSLNDLAYLYDSQGRYSEAEPLYIQALSILEPLLGINHPHTVTARENLAYLRDRLTSQ
ncbi:tetratricopeptide repeat-containing protein [Nostoc sp.]|uniref:tetratricopeptide repeat-containing protein n=1 Tax=Nostoc sp. TaxID=1180 RepID=UPI002FF1E162